MIVLRLGDTEVPQVHAVAWPLAELMSELHILAEPDHHPEARALAGRVSATLDHAYLTEFQVFSPLWARFRCRIFYPMSPRIRSVPDALQDLAAMPDDLFVELCAEGVQGNFGLNATADELVQNAHKRSEYLRYCQSRSAARLDLALSLLTDPAAFRSRLIDFLADSYERFFREEWTMVRDELQVSTEYHNYRMNELSPAHWIASLHPSATYLADANAIRFDKLQRHSFSCGGRSIIAVPSIMIGNHLVMKWHSRGPIIIHFPAGRTDNTSTGIEMMRQRLAALTSENRMELFRHLAAEPITTSEISSRLGQHPAQVSRDLGILRRAGFVVSERQGKKIYHRIRIETVLNIGQDLIANLLR